MWEERKIILFLIDYHSDINLKHEEKIESIKEGVEKNKFFIYVSKRIYGHEISKITEENREEWKKIRYLIDECLEDGYLLEKEYTHIEKPRVSYFIPAEEKEVSDGHFIFLTSNGKKLARWYYFYFKYLPEEFRDFKIILLAIIGTIITSPIWKPILSYLGLFFEKLFNKMNNL